MKYTIEKRLNSKKQMCIAPFIDRWNVWDIPEKEYTEAVELAIKHAFELGVRSTVDKVRHFANNVNRDWE